MLHLLRGGGKLPRNSTRAPPGRNGSKGCSSMVISHAKVRRIVQSGYAYAYEKRAPCPTFTPDGISLCSSVLGHPPALLYGKQQQEAWGENLWTEKKNWGRADAPQVRLIRRRVQPGYVRDRHTPSELRRVECHRACSHRGNQPRHDCPHQ